MKKLYKSKHSTLEELLVMLILPITFWFFFNMFPSFQDNAIGVSVLAFFSGVLYFTSRWLWFDKRQILGIGADEFWEKFRQDNPESKGWP